MAKGAAGTRRRRRRKINESTVLFQICSRAVSKLGSSSLFSLKTKVYINICCNTADNIQPVLQRVVCSLLRKNKGWRASCTGKQLEKREEWWLFVFVGACARLLYINIFARSQWLSLNLLSKQEAGRGALNSRRHSAHIAMTKWGPVFFFHVTYYYCYYTIGSCSIWCTPSNLPNPLSMNSFDFVNWLYSFSSSFVRGAGKIRQIELWQLASVQIRSCHVFELTIGEKNA